MKVKSMEIRTDEDGYVDEGNILIKQSTRDSINNYIEHGFEPGGFVRSCLENDLMGAMGRADVYNRASLFQITQYIYNDIPSASHGSPAIVQAWLDKFREMDEVSN